MKDDFFAAFLKFNMLKKKECKMSDEFVDLDQKIKECRALPYFIMDITSGELLSIFSVSNVDTAIRSFKMTLDTMPENLVHDAVLVKYDGRELVMEGKDYLDEWKRKQDARASRLAMLNKGM